MNKSAHYHQQGKEPILLTVLKDHKNGTVDLGTDGLIKVGSCQISTSGAPGTCTLIKEAAEAEAAAAEKAAAEAAAKKAAEPPK